MSQAVSRRSWNRTVQALVLCGIAGGWAQQAAAQGTDPLRKTDVVRLLSSPVISRSEIAALIRRNCLAFRPSERDRADLRRLGADSEILGSVSVCADRSKARAQTPVSALMVVPLTTRIVTPPDTDASVRILVKRGDVAEAGVALVLRGASDIPGVTDQRGMALFALRAGRVAGTYPLYVRLAGAAPSSQDPVVQLVVQPAAPVAAEFAPSRVSMDSADAWPVNVTVVVRDAFGNAVPGEAVALRGGDPEMNLSLDGVRTDSLGRAVFVIAPRTIRRAGRVEIVVREGPLASLRAEFAVLVSSQSRFVTGGDQLGMAGTQLNAPLVFQVRAGSGRPLAGRVVAFSAQNAVVAPDHAISDGAGLAQVQVTLGQKSGAAIVIASVDSVQTKATLEVQPAGATAVTIEHNNVRVDGGRVAVPADAPFALSVSALDGYGNAVPVAGLARVLQQMRNRFNARSTLLRMESVQADYWVTTVTFRPLRRGAAVLTLADATVSVDVGGRAGPVSSR